MNTVRSLAVVAAIFAAHVAAGAINQSLVSPPGGFVQAATFAATGSAAIPGQDIQTTFGTPTDFHETSYAFPEHAPVSASLANGTITNNATAESGMGYLKLYSANSSPSQSQFPAGVGNGGWKETFTINDAALNGQAGFFLVHVRVQGTFHAQGAGGSAGLNVNAYKNNVELTQNAYFDHGSGNGGGSQQRVNWGLASFNTNVNSTVDTTVTFSVPITFGTSFTLGIYGLTTAGQRAEGGFNQPCIGEANFRDAGITWAGIGGVLQSNGTAVTGYTVISSSGIDWSHPYTACGSADFNCDGDTGTDSDIAAFFACLSGSCPAAPCRNSADFNGDGDIGTDADIASFFRVLAGGTC